jgi:hypothetical protein
MMTISVGTFTKSIVLAVAELAGYFADAGIHVNEILVPSSPAQFEMLENGEIELAITSPDNVLAYRYLSKNPLGHKLDVRILRAVDRGLGLSLCYRPDLIGKPLTFGVDVPNSGFAFVGYELLARLDTQFGNYEVKNLGSTPRRRTALIAGEVDATILNAGNEIKAWSQGAVKISDVSQIGPYLGTVLSTLGKPTEPLLKLEKIISRVIEEILDHKHKDFVISIAMNSLELNEGSAEFHYATMLQPSHGLVSGGIVDKSSINTLIELRNKYLPTPELRNILLDYKALVSRE